MDASVFLSHYHYDHLQGLPFFTPIFVPQNAFTFYGAARNGQSVKEILAGQMTQPYFPVTAEGVFRAKLGYHDIKAGRGAEGRPGERHHGGAEPPGRQPGLPRGVRGPLGGVRHGHRARQRDEERFSEFAQGTDLLIYDSMYTEDEYCGRTGPPRTGWGHSTWQAAVRAADACAGEDAGALPP